MDFFGEYREAIEFLFGGVGVTLIGLLGVFVKTLRSKVKSLAIALEEEKAVSSGAALAMAYYDNFLKPLAHALADGSVVSVDGEHISDELDKTFVLWMPEDMPTEPHLRRRYERDIVSNRNDILRVTVEHYNRTISLHGKREGKELKIFDQPVSVTTLSYFAKVLDAAGFPKDMKESRKAELHSRERKVFLETIKKLVEADGLIKRIRVSAEPIAFL